MPLPHGPSSVAQYLPPVQEAPSYAPSWELVGPFPAGKLELDADPVLAVPVNASAITQPHAPGRALSLFSALRTPLRCMHTRGIDVGSLPIYYQPPHTPIHTLAHSPHFAPPPLYSST
jgi:hypothetical protein